MYLIVPRIKPRSSDFLGKCVIHLATVANAVVGILGIVRVFKEILKLKYLFNQASGNGYCVFLSQIFTIYLWLLVVTYSNCHLLSK